jgi:hypothetical protein
MVAPAVTDALEEVAKKAASAFLAETTTKKKSKVKGKQKGEQQTVSAEPTASAPTEVGKCLLHCSSVSAAWCFRVKPGELVSRDLL